MHDQRQAQQLLEQVETDDLTQPILALPEGAWHKAAILWLVIAPPADAQIEPDEALVETLASTLPALTALAREYHGEVIRRDDGLTVVFGTPAAYEDDAERAVQAALRMVQLVSQPDAFGQAPTLCRAAVSLGQVIVRRLGLSASPGAVIRGDPVDQASGIAGQAPPGVVWASEAVRQATERAFVFRRISPPEAGDAISRAWLEVVGPRERPAPARGLPGRQARLIGRDSLLRAMTDLAQCLQQGIGGLIWIEGEPGIGKSRLMAEFASTLSEKDILILQARATPQKTNRAFSLFADALTQMMGIQPLDSGEQIRAQLEHTYQTLPADAQMSRPYVEVLLGIPASGTAALALAPFPDQLRQQIFVALRRLLKSVAATRPMALFLDDLHWSDPVSAEALLFLLTVVTSAPVLFVCAQRRQGADLPNERLVRIQSLLPSQTLPLFLERLSPGESETLLAELLPDTRLPVALSKAIVQRSEGNPYFVEEYVRALLEQGDLHAEPAQRQKTLSASAVDLMIPSSIETLIRSRFDALPPELRQVVEYIAVIGSPAQESLLAGIPELSAWRDSLARLESRQLLRRGNQAEEWLFQHALIESVVYNSMLLARRQALHLRVAQLLEARWAGVKSDHAEQLAHHLTQAGELKRALPYLVLAGERAAARSANEEALSFFERAAQLLGPQSEASDAVRWKIAVGLGDMYRYLGRHDDSVAALRTGLVLMETANLPDHLRAGLHRRLGETGHKQGEFAQSLEQFNIALSLLDQSTDAGETKEKVHVLTGLAWTYFYQGRFDEARQSCEASAALAEKLGALSELAAVLNLLGGIYFQQSDWKSALNCTRRALILREQAGYTWGVASVLGNLGILAVSAGQWSKAKSFFERSLTQRSDLGDMEGVAIVHGNLGRLCLDQGEIETAEVHFRQSLDVSTLLKMRYHSVNSSIGLTEVLLKKGELAAAREMIEKWLPEAGAIGARDLLAEMHRVERGDPAGEFSARRRPVAGRTLR